MALSLFGRIDATLRGAVGLRVTSISTRELQALLNEADRSRKALDAVAEVLSNPRDPMRAHDARRIVDAARDASKLYDDEEA